LRRRGLRGIGLSLKIGNGDEVKIDDDGKFVFGTWATEGSEYDVILAREPISPKIVSLPDSFPQLIARLKLTQCQIACRNCVRFQFQQ
jgi:hypothetical protein